MLKVGLTTSSVIPRPAATPWTNCVFPAPKSPESTTTSPSRRYGASVWPSFLVASVEVVFRMYESPFAMRPSYALRQADGATRQQTHESAPPWCPPPRKRQAPHLPEPNRLRCSTMLGAAPIRSNGREQGVFARPDARPRDSRYSERNESARRSAHGANTAAHASQAPRFARCESSGR